VRHNLKWFLIWTVLHAISLLILSAVIPKFNIIDQAILVVSFGVGVTLIARLFKMLTRKQKLAIDSSFLFWCIVYVLGIQTYWAIIPVLGFTSIVVNLLVGGAVLSAFGQILPVLEERATKRVLITGLILALIVLMLPKSSPYMVTEIASTPASSGSIFDGIKSIVSSITGSSCPQLKLPVEVMKGVKFIAPGQNNEWKWRAYDAPTELHIFSSNIFCATGSLGGQNPNYLYCGATATTPMAYIEKTIIKSDGTIGETIRKSFTNVYSQEGQFLQTICGDDPDKIVKQEFDSMMNEFDEVFWD
jgi:hypothetical protein